MPALARPRQGDPCVRLAARGFSRRDRRHGDGCRGRYKGARSRDARSLLRPRGERGRPPFRAGFRDARRRKAKASRIILAALCSSPIFCAISTRTRRSAGSICRASTCARRASARLRSRARFSPIRRWRQACAPVIARARTHFREAARDHGADAPAQACARRESWRMSISAILAAWKASARLSRPAAPRDIAHASTWRVLLLLLRLAALIRSPLMNVIETRRPCRRRWSCRARRGGAPRRRAARHRAARGRAAGRRALPLLLRSGARA